MLPDKDIHFRNTYDLAKGYTPGNRVSSLSNKHELTHILELPF